METGKSEDEKECTDVCFGWSLVPLFSLLFSFVRSLVLFHLPLLPSFPFVFLQSLLLLLLFLLCSETSFFLFSHSRCLFSPVRPSVYAWSWGGGWGALLHHHIWLFPPPPLYFIFIYYSFDIKRRWIDDIHLLFNCTHWCVWYFICELPRPTLGAACALTLFFFSLCVFPLGFTCGKD